jgi:hypothetical protein
VCGSHQGGIFSRALNEVWSKNRLMNLQAFPLEFLQKFFPEAARAKPSSADSATTEGVSMQTGGVFLSATPRSIDEPGIVEIILRVRVGGPRVGFLDTDNRDFQQIEATTATSPIRYTSPIR